MEMTYAKARQEFRTFLRKIQRSQNRLDRSIVWRIFVEYLDNNLDTCQCPDCEGTGTSMTLVYEGSRDRHSLEPDA